VPDLIGVGYQGRTADELVAHLQALHVTRLVDVRLNPISRKPGLSKTALARALADAGIVYEHRRELGNPKTNRVGFAGSPTEQADARARYRDILHQPQADDALNNLAEAGRRERVAVLCFEADQSRCHRDLVLLEAQERMTTAVRPPQ
jgi:uncharacterized protein (DUF488 family)